MKNYMKIHSSLPWRQNFMFVDTEEYLADRLFIEQMIRINFRQEYGRKGNPYLMIFASCSKRNWAKAKEALDKLPNKMILCGHSDYEDYCNDIMARLYEERDKHGENKGD